MPYVTNDRSTVAVIRDPDTPLLRDRRTDLLQVRASHDNDDIIENAVVMITLRDDAPQRISLAFDLIAREHAVDRRYVGTSNAARKGQLVEDRSGWIIQLQLLH